MEARRSGLARLLGPLCCGLFLFVLLVLDGSAFFQTYAVDVEVRDEANITCLYAKWMTNFSVKYESNTSEYKNVAFEFPEDLTYHGSTCGNATYGPVLAIQFGEGHSWTVYFAKTKDAYQGNVSFTYNTDDVNLFPDAKRKGPITASASYPGRPVQLNTVFSCYHRDSVEAGDVTQDFWSVTLQAYMQNGTLSTKKTQCDRDLPSTTESTAVTTSPAITAVSTTTRNVTTTATAPASTSTPETSPTTGSYNITNGTAACLLADMGLQLNISQEKAPLIINISPKTTVATGSCGPSTAFLRLNDSNSRIIDFLFVVKNGSTQHFFLKGVNVTVTDPSQAAHNLHAENNSLSYWEASLGSSYMCQQQQKLVVNEKYIINTFDVRIQPFLVEHDSFALAEDCFPDVDNYFVPIMVGAALAGLVALVLLAYFVGHKNRRNVGYEQF